MVDPLAGLNEPQRQVVQTTQGPVLVLAGAGSGKTRALTHRLAYILQRGLAAPAEVMAVTFTNKAAQEMRTRIERLQVSTNTPRAIGTFHSLSARMLRTHHHYTTRSAGFTILDTTDTEQIVRQELAAQSISSREWSPRTIRHAISRAKHSMLSPDELARQATTPQEQIVAATYARYATRLAASDTYDFDDLILEALRLLKNHPEVRRHYQQQWRYLSVDEYQDTNGPQEQWLQLLVGNEQNICAVGDDYQAIYSWRGARVDHILQFAKYYHPATTIYLTQNYRSTPAILNAANHVIAANQAQQHKKLWTTKPTGAPVSLHNFPSDRHEAAWVYQQIAAHITGGGQAAAWAILYRTNAQSRLFEEQFIMHRLPYTIVGGFRFYDRLEVKDALALLQLYVNPRASVALARLTRCLMKGVGAKTIRRVLEHAPATSLIAALTTPGVLSTRQQIAARPLVTALASVETKRFANVALILQHLVTASGYGAYLATQADAADRVANVEELYNIAAGYSDARAFLEEVSLMSDIDEAPATADRVLCMTLHAAKGLEFDHVCIVGCEEELLPHRNSWDKPSDLEEERRLLYVGMTRAKVSLTLTHAERRALRGAPVPHLPSRFLRDLPAAVERHDARETQEASSSDDFGLYLAPSPAGEPVATVAEVGDLIAHPRFGQGVVIQTSGSLLTCVFQGYGVKTIDGAIIELED